MRHSSISSKFYQFKIINIGRDLILKHDTKIRITRKEKMTLDITFL